ncbi:MAG: hypothetical protein V1494_05975 [Candidatus Diapherotrites archaeon]
MEGIESIYNKDATELSLSELKRFLSWCEYTLHYAPVIIGGWAVYAFTPKIGSIDIDIVLKKKDFKKLAVFFSENGYAKKEDEPNIYFKEAMLPSGKTETMRFDLIALESKYAISREPNVSIPIRLVEKHSKEISFERQKIIVPEKELLLIQKVAAYRNREDLARTGHLRLAFGQREWNERKIAKDKEDIKNLIESGIDFEKLEKLLEKTGFKKIYEDALKEIDAFRQK